jgi:cytochrome c5
MTAARRRPLLAAVLLVLALVALAGAPASAGPPATAGTLTASAAETVWSEYVTLTATMTVPKGSPKPTGEITFADDDGPVGAVALANGVARLRTKALTVGTHVVTALHEGIPVGEPVVVTVAPARTTTALVSKKTEVLSGTAWFQATVATTSPATTTPTGWVEFTVDGAEEPAGQAPVVGGVASWRPRLTDGPHTVTATFEETGNHRPSTSTTVEQRIGAAPTDPPDPGPSTIDQQHDAGDAGRPAGAQIAQTFTVGATGLLDRVDYRVLSTTDGEIAVAVHRVDDDGVPTDATVWSGLARPVAAGDQAVVLDTPVYVQEGEQYALVLVSRAGSTILSAAPGYAGGQVHTRAAPGAGSWNRTPFDLTFATWVRPAATADSTLAASATERVWSEYVTLTATVTGTAGAPTGTVRFSVAGTVLGAATVTRGVATLRTKGLPAGVVEVTATYGGDGTYAPGPVAGSAWVTVTPATTTTTLVSKKAEVLSGTAWFQVRVAADGPATGTPAGTVQLLLDGDPVPAAEVPLVGGVASWRPRLADGVHTVTAVYVGSDQAQTSTSAEVVQPVGTPASTVDQGNGPATGFIQSQLGYSVGQSFTVGRSGVLDRVTIDFEAAGRCVLLAIWDHDFDQPMGITGPSTIFLTQEGPMTVDLTAPVEVEAGETFVIVLDTCDGDGSPLEVGTTGNTYAEGSGLLYDPDLNWWATWDPWTRPDLAFETWVRPAPAP